MTNMKAKILHTEERYSRVAVRAKLSVEVEQKKRLGAWGRRVLVLDGATLYAYKVKGEGGSVGGWAVGGADVHVGKSNDEGRHLLVISRPPVYKLTFSFTTTYEQARMIQALSSSGATVTGLEAIMLLKNLRKRQQREEKEEEEERKRLTMEEGLILQTLPNPADLLRGGGGGGGGKEEEEEEREVSKVHINKEEEEKQSLEEEGDKVQQVEEEKEEEEEEQEEEEEEEEEISEAIYNYKAFSNIFSFSANKKLAEEEEEEQKEEEKEEDEEETNKEAKKQEEEEEEEGEDERDSKVDEEPKENKEKKHGENEIMTTQGDQPMPHATSSPSKTSSGGEVGGGEAQGVEGRRINPVPKPPRVQPGSEGRLTVSNTISDESVSQSTPTSQGEGSEGVDLKEEKSEGGIEEESDGKEKEEEVRNELLKEGSEGDGEDSGVKEVRERSEEVREGEVKEVKRSEGESNDHPSPDLYPSDLREKEEEEEEEEEEAQKQEEKEEKEEEEEEEEKEAQEKEEKEEEEEEKVYIKEDKKLEKEKKEENKQEEKYKEEEEGNKEEEEDKEQEDKEEEEEEVKHRQEEDKQTYTELVTKMRLDRGFTLDTHAPSSAQSSELPSPNDDATLDSPISPCTHSPSSHSPPNGYKGEKSETWLSDALSDSEEQFERLYNELSKTLNQPTKPQEDEKVESYENTQPDSTLVTPESPTLEKTELQRSHSIIKKDGQNGTSNSGKKVQFDPNVKSIDPPPDPILYDVHKAKENGDARPGVTQIREKISKILPQTKLNENVRKIEENKRKRTPSPSSPVKKKPQVSAQVKTARGLTAGEGGTKRRQGLVRTSSPVTPASPTKTVKKTEAEDKGRKTMGEDKTKKTINEDKGKKIEETKKGGKNEKVEKIKVEDKTKKTEKKEEIRIARKDEKAEEKTEKKEEIMKGERDEETEEKKEKKDETEKEKEEKKDEMKKTEQEDKKENTTTENKKEDIDKKTEENTERKTKTEEKDKEKEEELTTTTTTTTTKQTSTSGEVKGSGQRSNVRRQPTVDLQAPLVISGQVEMGGSIGGRLTPRRVEVRDGHLLAFISQASIPSSRLPLAGLSVTPMLGGGGGGGGGGASLILSRASRCMMVLKLGSRDEMMLWINTLSDEVLRVTPGEHLRGLTLYPSPEKEEEEEEEEKIEEESNSSAGKSTNQESSESVIEEEEEKREKEDEKERRKREVDEEREKRKKEELTEAMKEAKPDEPKNEEDKPTKEGLSLPSKYQRKQETSAKENGEVARDSTPKKTIIKSPNFMEHLNKFREQQKTETQAKKTVRDEKGEEGKKTEERGNRKTGDKQEETRSNKITALIKQVEGRDKEAGREGRKERETKGETERGEREETGGGRGGGGQLRLKQDKDSPKKTKEEGRTGSSTHPPLKRLSGQGKSSPTSPLSSPLTSPLKGEDVVDNYLLLNILPGKATTPTTITTTKPTTSTTTPKPSTTSKKSPPHTTHHHHHHSTSSSNRHANCFKPNDPISSFSRSISTSNTSLTHDEGRKTHIGVLKRSTSDMDLSQKRREGGLTRKGAVRVKSTGNRTSRRNSERDSLVNESESMHSDRTSVSSVISSRILEAKNVEIIEKEETKGSENEDTEDKENEKWPHEEHKRSTNLKLKKEEEGRGGGKPGVESNITWSVAATREKFELLCSISGENTKGKLTTKTPIARRRSVRMTQKRRRTQELNATTPRRQGTVRKSFVAAENDQAKSEKEGGRAVRRSLIASEGKEEREGKEDMGVRRLGGYGTMTHDEVDDENDHKVTARSTGSWPTKETVKEARKAFEGYANRTPTTTTTPDEGQDSEIQKEKLTVKKSPLTRTLNMIQDSIISANEDEFRSASPSFFTSNSQSRNDDVVICWKGPYIAQESEQEVLNNISNAFLAKRRLLNKEVALGRLTGRLNLLEEHLWGLQARLATEEQVKGGDRRGVERAIVSVEEEITEVTARLSVVQKEAQQAREKLEAAVAAGLSQWGDKGVLTPKSSLTRRRGRGAEEEEEEETTTEEEEEVEESEA